MLEHQEALRAPSPFGESAAAAPEQAPQAPASGEAPPGAAGDGAASPAAVSPLVSHWADSGTAEGGARAGGFDGAAGAAAREAEGGARGAWDLDAPWEPFDTAVRTRPHSGGAGAGDSVQAVAQRGVSGQGGALPHLDRIQASFGPGHDLSAVRAHVGGPAGEASRALGAQAFTTGQDVAFAEAPDLHTAAHEAAHVVQQQRGVQLQGGVGQPGDAYERQADAVADRVVQGQSAADLLGEGAAPAPAGRAQALATGGRPAWAFQRRPAEGVQRVSPWGQRPGGQVQLRGVRLGRVRVAPKELPADGKSTATATVHATGGAAEITWAIDGPAHGSSIDAKTGVITAGAGLGTEEARLTVKATDKGGATASGHLTLWEEKFYQAKQDYPKFVAGTYSAPAKVGQFDATYRPGARRLDAVMKLEFKFIDDNVHNPKDKWTPRRQSRYVSEFIGQARRAWNAKYTFLNVREPKKVWGKLGPVRLNFQIESVKAGGHFVIEAHRHLNQPHPVHDLDAAGKIDEDKSRAALHGGTLKVFQGDERVERDFRNAPDAKGKREVWDGEQARADRNNPGPILFDHDSATPKANPKLDFFATYMKRINIPRFHITVVGHASTPGSDSYNLGLARRRAQAVADRLRAGGVTQHPIGVRAHGEKGAGAGPDWQKVEISARVAPGQRNDFRTIPHEVGHLLGLGDEYPYAVGDKKAPSDHYDLVKEHFGQDYADQVAMQADDPSANIMHYGAEVRVHDYVPFWAALGEASATAPVPVPPMDRKDWKING